MALESAGFISALNSANPTASDGLSQGDDHIRLLKATLLATFPNFTAAALTSTQAQLDGAVGLAGRFPVVTADIAASAVTAAKIATDAVVTTGILAANVTTAKIANANITTALIADANVTYAKIQNVGAGKILGNPTGGAAVLSEFSLGAGLVNTSGVLSAPAFPPAAVFKNLSIKVLTGSTTVAVAADFVTTTDGTHYQTTAVSATCDLGAHGTVNQIDSVSTGIVIDTWYAIWVIAKADGTTATLASTSFATPSMPTGYTYKARVGAVKTIHGSATLWGTWQFGRQARYILGLAQTAALPVIASGTSGSVSTPSWTSENVSAAGQTSVVPTTASFISIILHINGNAGTGSIVAPNSSYGAYDSVTIPPPLVLLAGSSALTSSTAQMMMLESSNIFYASDASSGALLSCSGWEDNI
jgi:hypothetical protein